MNRSKIEIENTNIDVASLRAMRDCLVNLSNALNELLFEMDTVMHKDVEDAATAILQRIAR